MKLWKLDVEGDIPPIVLAEGNYAQCYDTMKGEGQTLHYDTLTGWWEVRPDGVNTITAYAII